jgi:hypothetical protein
MKKKAGKAKRGRKRVTLRDLAPKKGGAKGGATLLAAAHKVQPPVRGGGSSISLDF